MPVQIKGRQTADRSLAEASREGGKADPPKAHAHSAMPALPAVSLSNPSNVEGPRACMPPLLLLEDLPLDGQPNTDVPTVHAWPIHARKAAHRWPKCVRFWGSN